jgi:hypothetical protein
MKKLIIDRFEGNYAVCEREDKSTVKVPKYKLPLECYEGDCLILDADGMYQKDKEAAKTREKSIKDKMSRLFKDKENPNE